MRKQWEYLIFKEFNDGYTKGWESSKSFFDLETPITSNYDYESFEEAGMEGWELVSINRHFDEDLIVYVFKREYLPPEEPYQVFSKEDIEAMFNPDIKPLYPNGIVRD